MSSPVVFDWCSGTGQASQGFLDRGWKVYRFDIDRQFRRVPHTRIVDLRVVDWSEYPAPTVILFGTMCQKFCVPTISTHWNTDHTPKTKEAAHDWKFVQDGIASIERLNPAFWWMENPRAKLRRLMELWRPDIPRATTAYCGYGDTAQKVTDLWGRHPAEWTPRPVCKPNSPCHAPAPRSTSGQGSTQGKEDAAERGAWPYKLGYEMCLAVEKALAIEATPRIRDEPALRPGLSAVQSRLVGVDAHLRLPGGNLVLGTTRDAGPLAKGLGGEQVLPLAVGCDAVAEGNDAAGRDLELGPSHLGHLRELKVSLPSNTVGPVVQVAGLAVVGFRGPVRHSYGYTQGGR